MNYYLDLHLVSVHQFLIQVIKISNSFMTGLFFNSREMFDHIYDDIFLVNRIYHSIIM